MLMRIIAVGALATLLGASAFARADRYGAIAYSVRTGHYGFADNAGTRGGAERRALENCEGRDCKVMVWFRNSCGALATGEGGRVYGWAHDTSLREAKVNAVEHCRHQGGHHCQVVISACTP
jgi:hypothetical protein